MPPIWVRPTFEPVHPKAWAAYGTERWKQPPEARNDFRVTQDYDDLDLYWLSQGIRQIHGATDIGDGLCDSRLRAMRAGRLRRIVDATPPPIGPALGYEIDHGDGWVSEGWHVSGYAVPDGATVAAGQVVAYVGATGLNIGGCHAHLKVRHNGVWVDPTPIILGASAELEVPTAVFDDVKPGDPFYADIKWLKDHGITKGVAGTNNFAPKGHVTRGQMAAFLRRLSADIERRLG
jgi:hypothetical protein